MILDLVIAVGDGWIEPFIARSFSPGDEIQIRIGPGGDVRAILTVSGVVRDGKNFGRDFLCIKEKIDTDAVRPFMTITMDSKGDDAPI